MAVRDYQIQVALRYEGKIYEVYGVWDLSTETGLPFVRILTGLPERYMAEHYHGIERTLEPAHIRVADYPSCVRVYDLVIDLDPPKDVAQF